jgi:ribosomal-protein-alanine N-acetyltransferase
MLANYLVQPLTITDAESLASLHQELFEHAWNQASFTSSLSQEFSLGFKIVVAQKVVAFVMAQQLDTACEILTLAVAKNFQHQGLATKLLQELKNYAKERDWSHIFLEVDSQNLGAIALYEKFGFVRSGERKNYYVHNNGSRTSAVLMQFNL